MFLDFHSGNCTVYVTDNGGIYSGRITWRTAWNDFRASVYFTWCLWAACFFGIPGRSRCFAWNHRWIYYWLFIYSIMYVGNREAFWTITGCSCYFHGGGTTCMLCIWNCMVHAGISTFHRCCELDDGTWLVCHSIFDTRCNKNRIGIFLIECVKKVR